MATMTLYFDDADPVASCLCGWHTHGDSLNDAVLGWTAHLTGGRCPHWNNETSDSYDNLGTTRPNS